MRRDRVRGAAPPRPGNAPSSTPLLRPATQLAWRVALGMLLVAILLLALLPAPPQRMDTGWDKLNHLLAFGVLALCVCMSEPASWRRRWPWLIGLLGYGAAIEALQLFTPHRQGEWGDLLADALGIVLGTLVGMALLRWAARRPAASHPIT